jgi:hypothetical protein
VPTPQGPPPEDDRPRNLFSRTQSDGASQKDLLGKPAHGSNGNAKNEKDEKDQKDHT